MIRVCQCRHGLALCAAFFLSACSANEPRRPEVEFGAQPALVAPHDSWLPTVRPAKAVGWPEGLTPQPAEGLTVTAFARDLEHPRWVVVLPNGDVLAVESNKPARSGGFGGLKGWLAGKVMAYAGAGVESANRITLLRDQDGDGRADVRHTLLRDLHSPLGVALLDDGLYVANTDALWRYPYREGITEISHPGEKVVDLPAGARNHHWTKNLIAAADGTRLYVAVGSNSNIAENGLEAEHQRAAILEVDPVARSLRVFADGLRNPVGMAWEPTTGALWAAVNERDELGDQLVPDYITSVVEGGFYGWPWSYWGDNVDSRVQPQRPDRVATARAPDYAVGAHTASLGLAFYDHPALPAFQGHALVGQHGSWNRYPRSGYRVIRVPFVDGQPVGMPVDVLSGFLSPTGEAYGRPAGVAVDRDGGILVADDVGNTVWRVAATSAADARANTTVNR
jgi:glucose/arabinose dehydrogenase